MDIYGNKFGEFQTDKIFVVKVEIGMNKFGMFGFKEDITLQE